MPCLISALHVIFPLFSENRKNLVHSIMRFMVGSLKNGRVLKESKSVIAPIITVIFEKFLLSGRILSDWKHANVCPVNKKGNKHDPKNYRPVSLTCICCKLL